MAEGVGFEPTVPIYACERGSYSEGYDKNDKVDGRTALSCSRTRLTVAAISAGERIGAV